MYLRICVFLGAWWTRFIVLQLSFCKSSNCAYCTDHGRI